jgi:predicted amidohydrolase
MRLCRSSDRGRMLAMAVITTVMMMSANHLALASEEDDSEPKHRITLAQIFVTTDVAANMERIRRVFAQAEADQSRWILFPEGSLSGYYDEFDQQEVAAAFDEIRNRCRKTGINALVGTCWKEGDAVFNEIRIVSNTGELVGRYAKTCLTRGDARQFQAGTFPLVHRADGVKFGTLICNDLWVTPGFSDGPNPHLSLQQAKLGAQVIFHAVNSGSDQRYRQYHEANLKVRSAEAKCPIIVVNAAQDQEVNCASGIVDGFAYSVELPRQGEVIRTVEFTPAKDDGH